MQLLRDAWKKYHEEGLARLVRAAPRYATTTLPRQVNQQYHSRGGRQRYNPDGVEVLDEEWDNLLILDACRFDALEAALARREVSGMLEHRISRGSKTPEWLYGNFAGRSAFDTVYVSGTSYPYHVGVADRTDPDHRQRRWGFDLEVHDLVDVWRDASGDRSPIPESNDLPGSVVPPDRMRMAAEAAAERYPHKRLIVHFCQPHSPYFGKTGEKIHSLTDLRNPFKAVRDPDIEVTREMLRRAYRENLELVLSEALELADGLDGRTVISSDHGELLGDRSGPIPSRDYGHPPNMYVPELVKVPWLILDGERRKTVATEPEESIKSDTVDEEAVGQLEALGYMS